MIKLLTEKNSQRVLPIKSPLMSLTWFSFPSNFGALRRGRWSHTWPMWLQGLNGMGEESWLRSGYGPALWLTRCEISLVFSFLWAFVSSLKWIGWIRWFLMNFLVLQCYISVFNRKKQWQLSWCTEELIIFILIQEICSAHVNNKRKKNT
jgi:hypothetical protein